MAEPLIAPLTNYELLRTHARSFARTPKTRLIPTRMIGVFYCGNLDGLEMFPPSTARHEEVPENNMVYVSGILNPTEGGKVVTLAYPPLKSDLQL